MKGKYLVVGVSMLWLTGCVGDVVMVMPPTPTDSGAETSDGGQTADGETLHHDGDVQDSSDAGMVDPSDTSDAEPAHCFDGILNGGETDIDCGGTCGRTCGTGRACLTATDCISGTCSANKCF